MFDNNKVRLSRSLFEVVVYKDYDEIQNKIRGGGCLSGILSRNDQKVHVLTATHGSGKKGVL